MKKWLVTTDGSFINTDRIDQFIPYKGMYEAYTGNKSIGTVRDVLEPEQVLIPCITGEKLWFVSDEYEPEPIIAWNISFPDMPEPITCSGKASGIIQISESSFFNTEKQSWHDTLEEARNE